MMNWWSSIYQFFFLLKIILLTSENSLPNPRSQIHFVVNFVYDTEYVRSLFSFYLANICRIVSITHALIQSTWVCNLGLTYSHLHTAWTQEVAFAPHSHTRGDCFARSALGLGSDLYCFQPPDSGKEVTPSPWAWVSPTEHGSNNPDLTGLLWGCGGMTWKQDSRHTHTHTHTHTNWGNLSGKKMGLSDTLGWRDRVGLNGQVFFFKSIFMHLKMEI